MSTEGLGRSISPDTPPLADGVAEQQQGIIDRLAELDARARAAEHNELQMYRLLVPRLVDELNEANAQNEGLQQMIRESGNSEGFKDAVDRSLSEMTEKARRVSEGSG